VNRSDVILKLRYAQSHVWIARLPPTFAYLQLITQIHFISDLLSLMMEHGFPEDATAKIVRHADTRPGMDLDMLERGGWI